MSEIIAEFRGGAPLKPTDFVKSGVMVLPKGAVGRDGWLRMDDSVQFCTQEYADAHANNQVDETYTIVVLRDLVPSGPSIGLMVEIGNSANFLLAQGVYGFKLNSRAEPSYITQLSNTRWYRHLMNSIMVGSTQVHVTNTAFKLARIPLPPLPEQRAIAEALSDADASIAALEAMIAKKRDLKQAAMQHLLTGKTRLPGFSGEWEVKRLGELCDVDPDNLGSGTAPSYFFKYISLEDVSKGQLLGYSELEFRFAPSRARRKLQSDDILVSTVRPNLQAHLHFKSDIEDWVCSTGFAVLRCVKDKSSSGFIFQHLFGDGINQQIEKLITGSNYPAINSREVRLLEILAPCEKEQTAIAEVLSDMDADLTALEARAAKARAVKQGMMQELLTGKVRLV